MTLTEALFEVEVILAMHVAQMPLLRVQSNLILKIIKQVFEPITFVPNTAPIFVYVATSSSTPNRVAPKTPDSDLTPAASSKVKPV